MHACILHTLPSLQLSYLHTCIQAEVCPRKAPEVFKVYIESNGDSSVHSYISENIPPSMMNAVLVLLSFVVHNSNLPFKQTYSVTVQAENKAGKTNSTGSILLCKSYYLLH